MARKLPKTVTRALEQARTIEEFAKLVSTRYDVSIWGSHNGKASVYLSGRGMRDYWLEIAATPEGLKLLQARVLVW